jgi:hypothetical protein
MPQFKLAPGAEWSSASTLFDWFSGTVVASGASLTILASAACVVAVAWLSDGLTLRRSRRN